MFGTRRLRRTIVRAFLRSSCGCRVFLKAIVTPTSAAGAFRRFECCFDGADRRLRVNRWVGCRRTRCDASGRATSLGIDAAHRCAVHRRAIQHDSQQETDRYQYSAHDYPSFHPPAPVASHNASAMRSDSGARVVAQRRAVTWPFGQTDAPKHSSYASAFCVGWFISGVVAQHERRAPSQSLPGIAAGEHSGNRLRQGGTASALRTQPRRRTAPWPLARRSDHRRRPPHRAHGVFQRLHWHAQYPGTDVAWPSRIAS